MDHLEISASHHHILVPCLCSLKPSCQPFLFDYPESNGWFIGPGPSAGIKRLDGTIATPRQVAAFLQEWLFFGLLNDALKVAGVQVELTDFVREDATTEAVITTRHLRRYLDHAALHERGADIDRCIEGQSDLAKLLKAVQKFFVTHVDSVFSTVRLDLGIHLSILVLAETLRNAGMYIWKLPETSEYPLRRILFHRVENLLKDRLLNIGRCLSETEMLRTAIDNTGLYIASTIEWPQIEKQRLHDNCTEYKCLAEQVDDATYQTAHTVDCADSNTCRFSSVDIGKATMLLRNGKIPLVRIIAPEDQNNHTVNLEILSDAPYVAISHVWAHGLGNTTKNALPHCQLLRLKYLTSSLLSRLKFSGGPLIWIDTLCIPVDPALADVRKLAISKIAKTFQDAKQVLVLDAELQQSSAFSHRNELCTRVLCSGWMRRLWTLQEAVVTERGPGFEKLYLQFRETAISVYEMLQTGILSLYFPEKAFQELMANFPRSGSAITDLNSLTHALRRRSTSNLSDEAICLASILGLDIDQVVQAGNTPEIRMCAFYKQLSKLPQHILFHRTECLQTDGYRWAPSSFTGTRYLDFDFHRPDSHIVSERDDNGLRVRFPGFILTGMTPPGTITEHFYFRDPTDSTKLYHLVPEDSGVRLYPHTPSEVYQKEFIRWAAFDRTVYETKELAVIWRNQIECVLVRVMGNLRSRDGVEEEIWGSYLSRGRISLVKIDEFGWQNEAKLVNRSQIVARKVPDSQCWCVS